MKKIILLLLIGLFFQHAAKAQSKNKVSDYSSIRLNDWMIPQNDTLTYATDDYSGHKAMLLKRTIQNYKAASIAYPKDLLFEDGIIELDIASPNGKSGFVGLAFHISDQHHYETIYFRPGSSNTINAIQYMPEKQEEFNWWDYESEKYQAKAMLPLTEWFHVKVVVKGKQVTVFLRNETTPSMQYNDLDSDLKKGSVGFWLGNAAIGAYKNLVVTTKK